MSVPQRPIRITWIAAAVFIIFAALLFYTHGNRLVWNNDEGIILDAAARMLSGQRLYIDFFGIMTPGSYWIQEAVYAIFGVSIRSGRIVVIVDFALQCSILFWLTAVLTGKKAAFYATIFFAAFQAANTELLLAQHRNDSAALALLSIVLCVQGQRHRKMWYWVAGGLLATAAALCTPTVGSIAVVTLVWVCAHPSLRRFSLPYGGGLAAGTFAILTVLTVTGMLKPMVDQMGWLSRNYPTVNYMPYGSVTGGYGYALADATGVELAIRVLLLFCIALPALLPVATIAAWGWTILYPGWKSRSQPNLQTAIPYLLGCMAILVVSTYPRSDVTHLAFVAVLPYVLAAAWLAWYAPRHFAIGITTVFGMMAMVFVVQIGTRLSDEVPVATPIGTVRLAPADVDGMRRLLEYVRPGDSLYVHPYRPMLYVLTQAHNPTRYSYIQPGLMTSDDEAAALRDLKKMPPKAIMYLEVERDEYLRVFPNAENLNHRFPNIEDWIAREYVPVEPPISLRRYRLYLRTARTSDPTHPSYTTEIQ
jgi:4-amino-4-deoxy-L-arabinose transferase-like glycosyltransferase